MLGFYRREDVTGVSQSCLLLGRAVISQRVDIGVMPKKEGGSGVTGRASTGG